MKKTLLLLPLVLLSACGIDSGFLSCKSLKINNVSYEKQTNYVFVGKYGPIGLLNYDETFYVYLDKSTNENATPREVSASFYSDGRSESLHLNRQGMFIFKEEVEYLINPKTRTLLTKITLTKHKGIAKEKFPSFCYTDGWITTENIRINFKENEGKYTITSSTLSLELGTEKMYTELGSDAVISYIK